MTSRPPPVHIPSLDGIRAVSFFMVFAAHAGVGRVVPGGFGVTVFFFLSGYLITTLMYLEDAYAGRVDLRQFYLRRALRILPPFYVVLAAATLLGLIGVLAGGLQPWAVGAQLLHFSNYRIALRGWGGIASGTGVYWSLAVEEHFYLVFPGLFLLMRWRGLTGKQMAIACWGLCAAVLAWRCALVLGWHVQSDRTYLCSDTRIDSILFGCALAVWRNPAVFPDVVSRPKLWAWVVLPVAIGVLLATFVVRSPDFRETLRYTLQGAALTPIFTAAVACPRWPAFAWLNWRPLRFVGTLSYLLYLLHHVALDVVGQHSHLPGPINAGIALIASVAIAYGLYRWVEQPCARLRKRLSAGTQL